ncbi:MAG: TatD family hydrolase [Burkholderiaceae bacterium]|nr:TatD family hydrolase [Burkholderiaceae bacterium]
MTPENPRWVDTHCHLDAPEFDADRDAAVGRARAAGVVQCVLPSVAAAHVDDVRALAHRHGFAYALGIHPLWVAQAADDDLDRLRAALHAHRDDPRLVAVGEIGLDHFVPPPAGDPQRVRETRFYEAQLALAREFGLPVILHLRRSADALLRGLRRTLVRGGIVHAFNGSDVQARAFLDLGFALGFGGAMTFERALRIRRLAATLPDTAIVLETDAPDIPPQWLYRTAAERAAGASARNEPAELPRIAATLAALRGWSAHHTAATTAANAARVLPRLDALMTQAVAA